MNSRASTQDGAGCACSELSVRIHLLVDYISVLMLVIVNEGIGGYFGHSIGFGTEPVSHSKAQIEIQTCKGR